MADTEEQTGVQEKKEMRLENMKRIIVSALMEE